MKRLVRASSGWIELDAEHMGPFGMSVRVTRFPEEGWATFEDSWNSKWPGENGELETFLVKHAELSAAEAAEIAAQTLREWRERGGEARDQRIVRISIFILILIVALALLGAAALAAAIVVVLMSLL